MNMNESTVSTQRGVKKARSSGFSAWKALQTMLSAALLSATLFTLWTPANLFSNGVIDTMIQSVQPAPEQAILPTTTASPRLHIGLVAGHWGSDSGSVCADGLTEAEVNLKIATMVKEILTREGYDVDLLKEFDPILTGYRALALVSIHNDSCDYINEEATGYKVAAASSGTAPERSMRLTECISQRYQASTNLTFHYNTITPDMTEYHAFGEINANTPSAIIETGFLNRDKAILTQDTGRVAQGVADGILCYVRNENIPVNPTATSSEGAQP